MQSAVVAGLLAFLADDGAEDGDEGDFVAAVRSEDGLGEGEDAEDDVGEGLGEGDGFVEVADWEGEFAGLDGFGFCIGEGAVGGEDVDLFLLGGSQLGAWWTWGEDLR